ncbi:hypothetical protein [Floridanema evergladense]|uniref:Uncharacterized protein n=1 Tax=Floridaenema evergladense BLCC-F167 TaxID=3153639 RepID=A0ABV4WD16_9CYAN
MNSPIDEALIVSAVIEECRNREWFLEFFTTNSDKGTSVFCRIEHSEGEVQNSDPNDALCILTSFVEAIRL